MMPDDTMGDDRNVVLNDLVDGAIASGQDGKTTLKNMEDALKMVSAEDFDARIQKRSQK